MVKRQPQVGQRVETLCQHQGLLDDVGIVRLVRLGFAIGGGGGCGCGGFTTHFFLEISRFGSNGLVKKKKKKVGIKINGDYHD